MCSLNVFNFLEMSSLLLEEFNTQACDFTLELEDSLDAFEVQPFARQLLDPSQSLEVVIGEPARPPCGSARVQQAAALVVA